MLRRPVLFALPILMGSGLVLGEWHIGASSGRNKGSQFGAVLHQEGLCDSGNDFVFDASPDFFRILNETMDTRNFQQEMSLKEVIVIVYEMLHADGAELPIIVNESAFKEEHPKAPDVYETKVRLPPVPRQMKVAEILRQAIAKVDTNNAAVVIKGDFVEITTKRRANIQWKLANNIVGDYRGEPLSAILGDLSAQSGCTIVVDDRAAVEINRPLTVRFRGDSSLGGAVRVVAELVDLKAVVLDGLLYVTTPARAAVLQKEQQSNTREPHLPHPEMQQN
jgi:hypothetical protein